MSIDFYGGNGTIQVYTPADRQKMMANTVGVPAPTKPGQPAAKPPAPAAAPAPQPPAKDVSHVSAGGGKAAQANQHEQSTSSVLERARAAQAQQAQAQPAHAGDAGETTVSVKHGDTLSKIAHAHGITLDALKQANPDLFKEGVSGGHKRHANGSLIYPGDTIKIPAKAAAPHQADAKADPVAQNQHQVSDTLGKRIADLQSEKEKTTKDQADPKKKPEAQARIGLLDAQISLIQGLKTKVDAYHEPATLSPDQKKTVADAWTQLDKLIPDLADPKKTTEARTKIEETLSKLQPAQKPAQPASRPAPELYYA